jgi:hypothetical protein
LSVLKKAKRIKVGSSIVLRISIVQRNLKRLLKKKKTQGKKKKKKKREFSKIISLESLLEKNILNLNRFSCPLPITKIQ